MKKLTIIAKNHAEYIKYNTYTRTKEKKDYNEYLTKLIKYLKKGIEK